MNVPAITRKTYDELKDQPEFAPIVPAVIDMLNKMPDDPVQRVKEIHSLVDDFNKEAFSHPLVKQFSPCTNGCAACCHTQVSVTDDEAYVLFEHIRNGIKIDQERLAKQASAQNDGDAYFKLSYEERRCIFLDENNSCRVYLDRPSVCRTNAVLGEADQCDTSKEIKPVRLVKTPKSDLVIFGSFYFSKDSGTLPYLISKILNDSDIEI